MQLRLALVLAFLAGLAAADPGPARPDPLARARSLLGIDLPRLRAAVRRGPVPCGTGLDHPDQLLRAAPEAAAGALAALAGVPDEDPDPARRAEAGFLQAVALRSEDRPAEALAACRRALEEYGAAVAAGRAASPRPVREHRAFDGETWWVLDGGGLANSPLAYEHLRSLAVTLWGEGFRAARRDDQPMPPEPVPDLLALEVHLLGPDHPFLAQTLDLASDALRYAHRTAEALAAEQQALARLRQDPSAFFPEVETALHYAANSFTTEADPAGAERLLEAEQARAASGLDRGLLLGEQLERRSWSDRTRRSPTAAEARAALDAVPPGAEDAVPVLRAALATLARRSGFFREDPLARQLRDLLALPGPPSAALVLALGSRLVPALEADGDLDLARRFARLRIDLFEKLARRAELRRRFDPARAPEDAGLDAYAAERARERRRRPVLRRLLEDQVRLVREAGAPGTLRATLARLDHLEAEDEMDALLDRPE